MEVAMRSIRWIFAVATALLAGCQTWGPTWSELAGAGSPRIDPERRPAILVRVGDESIGTLTPYKVAPGSYRVVVQAPPWRGFSGSEKAFTLDIAPCKRYYINAQFANPVGPDWTPVVDYVETIAGCKA
jgi:hypothetical protein